MPGWRCVVVCFLSFCALKPAGRALATDYYVSHFGDDRNPGTAAKPWRTLSKVNSTPMGPGDRILLESGQTFEGNLVLDERVNFDTKRPITIGSFGTGRAVIQAGLGTGILVKNVGGVIIRDLMVVGDGAAKNQGFGVMALNERGTARLDFIRIENVDASGFRWSGIYVGGSPTLLPGFKALPGSRFGFRTVEITHSAAHGNMYCGIFVSGPWSKNPGGYANEEVTIRDCVVYDNLGDPDYTKHHSGDGILVDDTDGGLVERCTAYHNGGANGSRTGGPVGIWADAANRITIQYCESYANHSGGDTDGGGYDLDGGVSNSLVQYNYSHDNDGPGFLVWNYKYAVHPLADDVIRYNVSENDGRKHYCGWQVIASGKEKGRHVELYNCASVEIGTRGNPVRNIDVYNNTVLATKKGNRVPTAVWVGGTEDIFDIHFRNNLLMTDGEGPLVDVQQTQGDVEFQGNAYWAGGKPFLVSWAGTRYDSLATWRAQTGQERLAGKDVGMFAKPCLSQVKAGETPAGLKRLSELRSYQLLPDSPLIDTGIDLRTRFALDVGNRDFWGTPIPQGKGFDIGAFEIPANKILSSKIRLEPKAQ